MKELVAEQQRNLDSLLEISKTLLEALKKGGGDEKLDGMLSERSRLLEAVADLDPKLRSEVEKNGYKSDAAYQKIQLTVDGIMTLDAECAAIMEREKLNLAGRLNSLTKGGAALKGYRGEGGFASKFLNIRK